MVLWNAISQEYQAGAGRRYTSEREASMTRLNDLSNVMYSGHTLISKRENSRASLEHKRILDLVITV